MGSIKVLRVKLPVILLLAGITCLIFGCKKDQVAIVPEVTTSVATDIGQTDASLGGNVISDGGASTTSRGVFWGATSLPATADNKTIDGSGTGSFKSQLTGLKPGTQYRVRAYAINNSGTGYGNVISFTTKPASIVIGSQEWMHENLSVTSYRNGDPIATGFENTPWSNLATGAYTDYDNSNTNGNTFGHLYNWYAVTDSRHLCPEGWHIPSDAEWTTLTDFLGGTTVAGGKMKQTGTDNWLYPNTGATDENGFTALPGGFRIDDGTYAVIKDHGGWWSSSGYSQSNANMVELIYNRSDILSGNHSKTFGASVRCVKD
jgi:uncharacterized protein (TIGR02145 family)